MLGQLIGSYNNQTFYPTSYNAVLLVGCNKTCHSKAIFWEMFEPLPVMPATLNDNTSVHERQLDHHHSRDNQDREWQSTDKTDAAFFLQPLLIRESPKFEILTKQIKLDILTN